MLQAAYYETERSFLYLEPDATFAPSRTHGYLARLQMNVFAVITNIKFSWQNPHGVLPCTYARNHSDSAAKQHQMRLSLVAWPAQRQHDDACAGGPTDLCLCFESGLP